MTLLFLIALLSGCAKEYQSSDSVQDDRTETSPKLISPCLRPFEQPPKTYGEAVEREPIWHASWRSCANQIEQLRQFYFIQSH